MPTINELKKQITDFFVSQTEIQLAYGLDASKSFDEQFSKVSIESILFYVVAYCHSLIYAIMAKFQTDQQAAIDAAYIANDRWWYNQVLSFILGAALIYDEKTYRYSVDTSVVSTPLVTYCAIRQKVNVNQVTYVQVMCAKADYIVLTEGEKTAMQEYLNRVKPAGVLYDLQSNAPDNIWFPAIDGVAGIQIYYDPMLMAANGTLLSDGTTKPVDAAIDKYVKGIVYGGKFNISKLIDAIQQATGVVDVYVKHCKKHSYNDAGGVATDVTTTIELTAGVAIIDLASTDFVSSIGYFPQSQL